jgi:hypothetical protein
MPFSLLSDPSLVKQHYEISASGGEVITIIGDNFGPSRMQNQVRVSVGGVPCVRSGWTSLTELWCEPPVLTGRTNFIRVWVAGQASVDGNATVLYVPYVRMVRPPLVQPDTAVIVEGIGFVDVGLDLLCRFGTVLRNATYLSPYSVTCKAPAQHPAAYLEVVVSVDRGVSFRAGGVNNIVEFGPPPRITALDPAFGLGMVAPPAIGLTIGARTRKGAGTRVDINGHFFRSSSHLIVKFGGVMALNVVFLTPTLIRCDAPALPAALLQQSLSNGLGHVTVPVMVSNVGPEQQLSNPFTYSYIIQEPVPLWLGPLDWGLAAGGYTLTLHCSGFLGSAQVTVRFGTAAVPAVVVNSTSLRVTVPPVPLLTRWLPHQAVTRSVKVTVSPNGVEFSPVVNGVTFTYVQSCRPGYFCPLDVRSGPGAYACPRGHFCSGQAVLSPTPCPIGSYQPNVAQQSCLPCPAGFFCSKKGTQTPVICPAGWVCDVGVDIGARQYNVKGLTSPSTLFDTGLSLPVQLCPAGRYCVEGTRKSSGALANSETCPSDFPSSACNNVCDDRQRSPCKCGISFFCSRGTRAKPKCTGAGKVSATCDKTPQGYSSGITNVCFAGFDCTSGSGIPQVSMETLFCAPLLALFLVSFVYLCIVMKLNWVHSGRERLLPWILLPSILQCF